MKKSEKKKIMSPEKFEQNAHDLAETMLDLIDSHVEVMGWGAVFTMLMIVAARRKNKIVEIAVEALKQFVKEKGAEKGDPDEG